MIFTSVFYEFTSVKYEFTSVKYESTSIKYEFSAIDPISSFLFKSVRAKVKIPLHKLHSLCQFAPMRVSLDAIYSVYIS